jgi:hypothetical protein
MEKGLHQKADKHLLKMHFGFILPLALCPVEDLHIKLQRTTMVVEDHEETLMQFMILCKLGPAAPEVHLATTVVVHLHFIWSSSSRFFMENSFTELAPVHEFSKLQRDTLLFTALRTSDNKEGEQIDRRRRRSIVSCSRRLHVLSSKRRRRLWFILTP